jgi:hypothetical protein
VFVIVAEQLFLHVLIYQKKFHINDSNIFVIILIFNFYLEFSK